MPSTGRTPKNAEAKSATPKAKSARWTQYGQRNTVGLGSSDFVGLGCSGEGTHEALPPLGFRVAATIKGQQLEGTVRFTGETQFKEGTWVGVELDTPDGKNDGSVQGVRYFTCPADHGIFIAPMLLQNSMGAAQNSSSSSRAPTPAAGEPTAVTESPELHDNEVEKPRRFSRPAQSVDRRKSAMRWEEKRRSRSLLAIKAELANAVEDRDLVELRRVVPLAARRCAERGGDILVPEVECAQRILEQDLAQKLQQHHLEEQQMLLKSHEDIMQMLIEVDDAGAGKQGAVADGVANADSSGPDKQVGETALQLQVSRVRRIEAHLAEMRRGAAERARVLEDQLEGMRQSTAEKMKVLEEKLDSVRKSPAASAVTSAQNVPDSFQDNLLGTMGRKSVALALEPGLEAEQLAFERTLNPHYILMSAEDDVAKAALSIAQTEAKKEPPSCSIKQLKNILGFIPNTLRRCIRHNLVNFAQWKVLLEPPLKSTYNPVLARFPAVVVFADASGFTRLTETLASQPQGAEKIGDTLNNFFRPLIGLVHEHGGDVIKFSGDALTIIWAAAEPAPIAGQDPAPSQVSSDLQKLAAIAAARFCLEVQEEIPRFGATNVPGCSLTMHIGVGFGMTTLLQLGGLMGRWEYCVAGSALEQISIAEPLASPGETVFSPEARELAASRCIFEPVQGRGEKAVGFTKLIGYGRSDAHEAPNKTAIDKSVTRESTATVAKLAVPSVGGLSRRMPKIFGGTGKKQQRDGCGDTAAGTATSPPWWWLETAEGLDVRLIRRFFPSAVHSMSESEDLVLEEMRRVSVLFCCIQGLDPADVACEDELDGNSPLKRSSRFGFGQCRRNCGATHTQLILRLVQRSVYALEGSVNKFLVDDKGVLLLVVFGLPPLIHFTDDPVRAVLCGMRVCDLLRDEGLKGHVGVSTGACWCGVVGTKERREYTVLGDVVNLSARLMGQAADNAVVVDEKTRDIAKGTLDFVGRGELRLKGKEKPVRAYQFAGIAKDRHQSENLQSPLLTWPSWPARARVLKALECRRRQSGVVFVSGTDGSGKGEIVELMRAWASQKGFTLLAGQNMDPSGTFACSLLCLQEAYRELVRIASKDPFWREKARQQIVASMGGGAVCQSIFEGAPGHTEIYWMLTSMLRLSIGEEALNELEPWAPLLNTVVTQLAFAPRMIQAMHDRNEQHANYDRLIELCEGVLGGFAAHGSLEGGTMVLLHIRRSSALLQKRDRQETAIINALAELCMRFREKGAGRDEKRPLVLCVVARREGLRDQFLEDSADQCDSNVELADLDEPQTAEYLQHLMTRPSSSQSRATRSSHVSTGEPSHTSRRSQSALAAPRKKKAATAGLSVPKARNVKAWKSDEDEKNGAQSHKKALLSPRSNVKFEGMDEEREEFSPRLSAVSKESDHKPLRLGRMAGCSVLVPSSFSPASRASSKDKPSLKYFAKRDSTVCEGQEAIIVQAVLAKFVFECTGGNPGEIEILVRDFERQELLRCCNGVLAPVAACGDLKWLQEHCQLPEVLVGMAFGVFEQLEPQHKMFLKAASAVPGEFGLEEVKAALPEMSDDAILDTFDCLTNRHVQALRKVSEAGLPRRENRYRFYSSVLSQASSTLVLETQRKLIKQRTTKFQEKGIANSHNSRRLSTLLGPHGGGPALSENEGESADDDSE